jgi:sec-independent protein translocase protein TatB
VLDVGLSEFFVIGAVALLVVGPKELPTLMARIGRWTGKARAMARHARSGWDAMVREAEIDEMNKRWEAENARIMAATQGQMFTDPLAPGTTGATAPATAIASEAEVDTFLPGLDGGMAEDRDRPAAAAPGPPPAPAEPAPGQGAPAAAAPSAQSEPDPTDWRDPPLMRTLPSAAVSAAATEPPAAAPAPAQLALGDATAPAPAPARPRRVRKTARAAAPPAAPHG